MSNDFCSLQKSLSNHLIQHSLEFSTYNIHTITTITIRTQNSSFTPKSSHLISIFASTTDPRQLQISSYPCCFFSKKNVMYVKYSMEPSKKDLLYSLCCQMPAVSVLLISEQHFSVRTDLRIFSQTFMKGSCSFPFGAIMNRIAIIFHIYIYMHENQFLFVSEWCYSRIGCYIYVCMPQYHTFLLSDCTIFIPTSDVQIPGVSYPCSSLFCQGGFLSHCNMCNRNSLFFQVVKDNVIGRMSSYLPPICRTFLLLYYQCISETIFHCTYTLFL